MVTEYLIKKKEELIERKIQVESLLNSLNATIREDSRMAELLESENKPAFSDFSPRNNRNDAKVSELQNQIEENLEKATRMQIKIGDLDDQMAELDQVIKEARELEKKVSDAQTVVEPITEEGGTDIVIEEDSDGQMSFEEPSEGKNESEDPESPEKISEEKQIENRGLDSVFDYNNGRNKTEDIQQENDELEEDDADETEQLRIFMVENLENIQKYLPSDPFRTKIEILQLIKKLK